MGPTRKKKWALKATAPSFSRRVWTPPESLPCPRWARPRASSSESEPLDGLVCRLDPVRAKPTRPGAPCVPPLMSLYILYLLDLPVVKTKNACAGLERARREIGKRNGFCVLGTDTASAGTRVWCPVPPRSHYFWQNSRISLKHIFHPVTGAKF
jgi:hypothetical protein